MDCKSISQRVFDGRSSTKHLKRPIAFIRNVFTGYAFQEMLLSSDYHPDNTYCYSVDKYSTTGIFENLQILSKCLPNVILNPTRYYFNSRGRFQSRAQFKCLEFSLNRTWRHALFLQNHDLVLKPADHLSEFSELLNDTSAMFFEDPHEGWYPKDADWTPAGLKLFKSEAEVSQAILHKPLRVWKGFNEIIVSRVFIESMFDKLNLEEIMNLFDQRKRQQSQNAGVPLNRQLSFSDASEQDDFSFGQDIQRDEQLFTERASQFYGVDEMLLQTLYRNYLGLEGQPTSNCTNFVPDTIIRWTDWTNRGTSGTFYEFCKSKLERHWICIMGVEYLADFMNTNFVIANKVLENYDVGPVICLKELFQKNEIKKRITRDDLQNYPQFREMEMKHFGTYEKDDFQCNK
ncbi:unnamed protein product [Caenorhabditis angaria]|uniref:Uncharacterized protein n=1 Tax=Caenorhabditis angaria TaxID=860376 RepID=A0A9P1J0A9_9PELO|nr:unnamed protein product [Caenorhabditis angaria]